MREYIRVRPNGPLKGEVKISGAKNSGLKLLAATLLTKEEVTISNLPPLKDVNVMLDVLQYLGSKVERIDETTVKIKNDDITDYITPIELMNKMRASFVVTGPLLSRFGKSITYMPGGCSIGSRPVDLHLKGFESLGAKVHIGIDAIDVDGSAGLKGAPIYLDFPSVGATENIMMAAVLAEGTTTIDNAAQEPEITDLANFLNKLGAKIRGAGTKTIEVIGVKELSGGSHTVMPDRIEAATYMVAAAMTKGDVLVTDVVSVHLVPIIAKLRENGAQVEINEDEDQIRVIGADKPKAMNIKTLPYPGLPTDVQSQFMTLLTISEGDSVVKETVFENRFMHVAELQKMRALIVTDGNEARIKGVDKLVGTDVKATDLRAGASCILAGLVAEGETRVHDTYHIYRGYYDFEKKFTDLGADLQIVKVEE
ncbi:UDP-N-acetylglucosamine 1-carboxyvinyltransferase [uncultured Helcococcus sp.]|uniref:UDP-N-acetylglucosamine 1-carboxyvinyltransferase n=1 Tax=uncultured Helcococcus sp. TaxID=1072508 RepID=UPI0026279FBA|nr:UDP-N-acetylglucosamine 1-carboxyvinyltransferase [uncultured Helcococcus sp.]